MRKCGVKAWSVRVLLGLLGLVALALLAAWLYLRASMAQLDGIRKAPGLVAAVSVARDDHGAPLLQGSNRDDLAYATGFVHAQDRFFQMDLLRRVGAGELAELFGARALPVDKLHRLHRFRARAELVLKAMSDDDRRFIDRYVAGINDGLGALGARPFEYALMGARPRAWTAADSLLVVWAMFFDLQGMQEPRELARGWIAEHTDAAQRDFLLPESTEWDAPLDQAAVAASSTPIPPTAPAWWGQRRSGAPIRTASAEFIDAVGSNNWSVAGGRSQDGAAIVSNDMHLGIQLPTTWYRLALQFPDANGKPRRMAGVTLPGAPPLIVVGSNGHVAWGFTNSYGDFMDLVALEADPADPARVRTPNGWETLASHQETILVKDAPAQKFIVRESSLGPLREAGGRTYAIHWIAHLPASLNANQRKLEAADTLDAALAVATTMGIPAQNFVAGDDKGNIGWTITGMLPHRAQAAGASFPIAAGGAATTWDRPLAPADYPKLVNPASGQLSTANSRQLMGAGAELIGDGGFDLGARNHQVRDSLLALGPKTDLKAVYAITMDDRAIFMAGWRTRAIGALDAAATSGKPQRAEFLRLLGSGWSGHASVESTGYRLARGFMWAMHDQLFDAANGEMAAIDEKAGMHAASTRWPVVLARLLDEKPAGWLPAAYPNWQALELAAIDQVIAQLTGDGKPLASATWGERNTAAIAHPIGMAAPALRRWLSAPADLLPGDANMPRVAGRNFGQSERLTVTPGKEEQGVFNMPGGQSGHPLSPYFLRGHEEWVAGKTVPLLPGPAVHTLRFER
jgi:penicillin amidase